MMTSQLFSNTGRAIDAVGLHMRRYGYEVDAQQWQGTKAPQSMWEAYGVSFRVPILPDAKAWATDVRPNLPWADDHFDERVSGLPTNPGVTWMNWPFYPKNQDMDKIVRPGDKFTHTYQERMWPKRAGDFQEAPYKDIRGIRYAYGDLMDVVSLLQRDPLTRQAFLPIWFPEDTGARHGGRVPCTLGYLFMFRKGYLHCTYYIRSCDYFRHFRDDVYLSGRLTQWICDKLKPESTEPERTGVVMTPGFLDMHIGSMHCWSSEFNLLPKGD